MNVGGVADFIDIEFVQSNGGPGDGKYFLDGIHMSRQVQKHFQG